MAQRGIREYHAKTIMLNHWTEYVNNISYPYRGVLIDTSTDLESLPETHSWLRDSKLVAKPDQLFGKRGKLGLVYANRSWDEVKYWLKERLGTDFTIGKVTGKLTHFIVEEYIPHKREYYLAFTTEIEGDRVYMSPFGGIYIEENWDKVKDTLIPVLADEQDVNGILGDLTERTFREHVDHSTLNLLKNLVTGLYKMFRDLHMAYLELNPFILEGNKFYPIDTVCRLDDTAHFLVGKLWGDIEFPPSFGREPLPEEKFIKELDEKTGASLKLTVLNPQGRIWTLVAGGGASVVYADTIADMGYADEMATYGEYSGNPSTMETYQYAKTVLDLMVRNPRKPKVLLIGGAIANFTDVAKTFDGIIMALREYAQALREGDVHVFVRRGGPNYRQGLEKIRKACEELGIPIEVYGPELHMTNIVGMAIRLIEEHDKAKT